MGQIIQYADSVEVGSSSTLTRPLVLKGKVASPRAMDWRTPKYMPTLSGTNTESGIANNGLTVDGFIDGPFYLRTRTAGLATAPVALKTPVGTDTGTSPSTFGAYALHNCSIDAPVGLDLTGGLNRLTNSGEARVPYIWDKAEETGGWNCFLLNFVGCGANTSMEIDVIMHIEGVANIIAGSSSYEGTAAQYQPFSQAAVNAAIAANGHTTSIRLVRFDI